MQQPVIIQKDTEAKGTSFKDKVLYSILALAGCIGLGYGASKLFKKGKTNKAEKKTFVPGSAQSVAKQLHSALENQGDWGSNTTYLREIITGMKTQEEVESVRQQYQNMYHTPLGTDMEKYLKPNELKDMLNIINVKPSKGKAVAPNVKYEAWANRLKAAFDHHQGYFPATDEDGIKSVFAEIPTQTAFRLVKDTYKRKYGSSLDVDLKGELEFWEYPDYMNIINSKPK